MASRSGASIWSPADALEISRLGELGPGEAHPVGRAHRVEPFAGLGAIRGIGLIDLQALPIRHAGQLAQALNRRKLDQIADRLMEALRTCRVRR